MVVRPRCVLTCGGREPGQGHQGHGGVRQGVMYGAGGLALRLLGPCVSHVAALRMGPPTPCFKVRHGDLCWCVLVG